MINAEIAAKLFSQLRNPAYGISTFAFGSHITRRLVLTWPILDTGRGSEIQRPLRSKQNIQFQSHFNLKIEASARSGAEDTTSMSNYSCATQSIAAL